MILLRLALVFLAMCTAFQADENPLAAALSHAKDAGERAALIDGQAPANIIAALDFIEKSAAAQADSHDNAAAIANFQIAVEVIQQAAQLPRSEASLRFARDYRRIGLCESQLTHTELALNAYRKGIAASEESGDLEILAENLHGASVQLNRFGRYRESEPLLAREYQLTLQCGHVDHQARSLISYSSVMAQLGEFRQAMVLGERALEVSKKSSLKGAVAFANSNLATFHVQLGDDEAALRYLRSIPEPSANDLNSLGGSEARLHQLQQAERDFTAALALPQTPADWRVRGAIYVNFGNLYRQMGVPQKARAMFNEGLTIAKSHGDLQMEGEACAGLSEVAAGEKLAAEALSYAEQGLRAARESDIYAVVVAALVARGRALELNGRREEAGQDFSEAVAVAEATRAESPGSATGLQAELPLWLPAYQAAIEHQLALGDFLEALRLADRAKARVLLDMLEGGESGLRAFADPAEIAEVEKVQTALAQARRAAIAKPDAAAKSRLAAALSRADDVNGRLYALHPELVLQRASAPDLPPAQLAALAPGRAAVLSYFVMPDSVELFVVRPGATANLPSVAVFKLPGSGKLEGRIRVFREQIAARDINYATNAKALFETLIGPASAALRGTDRWIISPDGPLWEIPFQALIDRSGQHLLESHSLNYAPSLTALWQLRQKRISTSKRHIPVLAVASSAADGPAALPDTERESQVIASLYGPASAGAVLLTGSRANPSLVRESAPAADIIHIASHAQTEVNHPLESFLLLAPGKDSPDGTLTARDLLRMKLQARLVVLSACETARGQIGQGEGVLGLGWAVLAAGAQSAVLSQWKVDSAATADLMIDFHRRLTAKNPPDKSEALRQASLAAMRANGRKHPYYWASFIVVGSAR